MKKYGQAAMVEMVMQALPEIAKNVAEPLSKVDSIFFINHKTAFPFQISHDLCHTVLGVQIPAERRSHSEMNGMYIPT